MSCCSKNNTKEKANERQRSCSDTAQSDENLTASKEHSTEECTDDSCKIHRSEDSEQKTDDNCGCK